MKILTKFIYFNLAILLLVGCADKTDDTSVADASEASSGIESKETVPTETDEDDVESEQKETENDNTSAENSSSKNNDKNEETSENILSDYSSEEIEYARVWLQLGPNQELDELYARHIPADTPLHPEDETSANYPEAVIQLSGTRLVDGSVTYSGN